MRILHLLTLVAVAVTTFAAPVRGETIEEAMPTLVEALAKQLVKKEQTKVAAVDFTDIQSRPNELGRYLAEQLSVDLVMAEGITVVDRANLEAIMEEHKLTAEGLVKPENAKKLGEFAGVDTILIGTLAVMGDSVTLTVKGISTESSEVVAAGRMQFDETIDTAKMLSSSVGSRQFSSTSDESGKPEVSDRDALFTKEVGPLHVSLRNVTTSYVRVPNNRYHVPAIQLTFDLENRSLKDTVAVAANQGVVPSSAVKNVSLGRFRATILGEKGRKWTVPDGGLRGISSIYCFESRARFGGYSDISQSNPANVIDYIKRGRKYTHSGSIGSGQFWGGGFSKIAPGDSLRITASFSPDGTSVSSSPRTGRSTDFEWPNNLQVDVELIIGTLDDGEKAEASQGLNLRNITIDKVSVPASD